MRRLIALALFPLALAGTTVSAAGPTVVGIAAAIVNDVRIKSSAARQFARAALLQRVALADQVQTGGGSRLQLLLLDRSKFTVGANARLTIDRFVYDPNGGSMSATVAKGAFRFMSGRSGGRRDASIKSPAATIGIRGTLLDGAVGDEAVRLASGERDVRGVSRHDPATATLIVLRGPGPRRQGNDAVGLVTVTAGGRTVTLDRPLMAAYVPYAGAPPILFEMSTTGVARLNDLLIEPRDILNTPDAPEQPYMAQTQRERPYYDRPYYDRPPPGGYGGGGFDGGGPGPRDGGGYGGYGGGIPGMGGIGGYPSMPDRPMDRPQRGQSSGMTSTPGTTSTPRAPRSDAVTSPPHSDGWSYPPQSTTPGRNDYPRDTYPPDGSSTGQSNPYPQTSQDKPPPDDLQVR